MPIYTFFIKKEKKIIIVSIIYTPIYKTYPTPKKRLIYYVYS